MKKALAILVVAMLALSMQVFAIPVSAEPVPKPGIVDWLPGGQAVHDSLACDPEWLKVVTVTHVSHTTWIHVLGKDTIGQNIEAKVEIPESTPPQLEFPLIDVHSGLPVTFARITDVYQQGGEHCNIFQVHTLPEPEQEYLGMYHLATGYTPTGEEPSNPDPLKIALNWIDANGDGQPTENECTGPLSSSDITIKGLDQYGDMLEHTVTIPAGSKIVPVDVVCHTWSVVCTVRGGIAGVSYYIFTHPKDQRAIFEYKIEVDHISVTADPKNILADGTSTSTITITLLDQDDHEVHWTIWALWNPNPALRIPAPPIEINVMATGGSVEPSLGILIPGCNTEATTTLTSDTNARIVRVTALAIVPDLPGDHCPDQLFGEDYVCFDGINSVPYEPVLDIRDIGGETGRHYAVLRQLFKGCNLISIPVIPDETLSWDMLPCTDQCLISVATYQGGVWLYYDFEAATGDIIDIRDGWAYWVKTKKPCTLVISGRTMDQYDDATGFGLPPMYPMTLGWNFVGVTSIQMPIATAEYLESLKDMGLGEKLWGPVWIYRWGTWIRNPPTVWPTEGMWLFTYDGLLAP